MPRLLCILGAVLALALCQAPEAHAQDPEPVPRYVVDVRGATVSLPTTEGWTPTIAAGTDVPGRGVGIEIGAHVYPLRLGTMTIGLGGSWTGARGTSSPDADIAPVGTRAVTTTLRALAPQLSFNFGHRLGWSYLSGGIGRARIESVADGGPAAAEAWSKAINYGGGARWFLRDRIAVGFDLRFHQLSPRPPTDVRPGGARIKQMALSVGLSIR